MANPLMFNGTQSQVPNNPMNALFQMLGNGGGNPQQMVQMLMQRNPKFQQIMNQVKNSGMTTEQYARQYAKQNGIDIEQLKNTITGKR